LELVYGPFQSLGVACTCRCETVTLESPITFLPICRLFVGITAASGSQVRRAWREPFSNRPDPDANCSGRSGLWNRTRPAEWGGPEFETPLAWWRDKKRRPFSYRSEQDSQRGGV